MKYEEKIRAYFSAWLDNNAAAFSDLFAEDVIYSECYGPEYHGLGQILCWFADWNQRGKVLRWDIKNTLEKENTLCVEWYFLCEYDGNIDGFDGVSWIEFNDAGKIKALREFQSKAEHYFPYACTEE